MSDNLIVSSQFITQRDIQLGQIQVMANMDRLNAFVSKQIIYSSGVVFIIIVTLSFPLARWFQSSISEPITGVLDRSKSLVPLNKNIQISKRDELNELEQIFIEIAQYIRQKDARIYEMDLNLKSFQENEDMTLRFIEDGASTISVMSEFSEYYLSQQKTKNTNKAFLEISKVNTQKAKEFHRYVKEIQEMAIASSKAMKTGRIEGNIFALISDSYSRLKEDEEIPFTLNIDKQAIPDWPLYPFVFCETVKNIFHIFHVLCFDHHKYSLDISFDYSPKAYGKGLLTIAFKLSPLYESMGPIFKIDDDYYLVKLFNAKYLNNLNTPDNNSSSIIVDILEDAVHLQMNLPYTYP